VVFFRAKKNPQKKGSRWRALWFLNPSLGADGVEALGRWINKTARNMQYEIKAFCHDKSPGITVVYVTQ